MLARTWGSSVHQLVGELFEDRHAGQQLARGLLVIELVGQGVKDNDGIPQRHDLRAQQGNRLCVGGGHFHLTIRLRARWLAWSGRFPPARNRATSSNDPRLLGGPVRAWC